jgi:N-acetylglutamate synthase-like GNAT family acetyltransferase
VTREIVAREDGELGTMLEERLYEFNRAATGHHGRELAFAVEEDSETLAGLAGYTWGGMAEVRQLWVREDHRHAGLGSALMRRAIEEATARGCRLMFLTTHSFQAPGFYARLGFEELAVIRDKPPGHAEHILRLTLP